MAENSAHHVMLFNRINIMALGMLNSIDEIWDILYSIISLMNKHFSSAAGVHHFVICGRVYHYHRFFCGSWSCARLFSHLPFSPMALLSHALGAHKARKFSSHYLPAERQAFTYSIRRCSNADGVRCCIDFLPIHLGTHGPRLCLSQGIAYRKSIDLMFLLVFLSMRVIPGKMYVEPTLWEKAHTVSRALFHTKTRKPFEHRKIIIIWFHWLRALFTAFFRSSDSGEAKST